MGLLIGAHVVASGQQAPLQVPGALRSRVTVVPVAVYVTDLRGRPVADLKESDFTVREDGVRQSITSFSTQEFRQTSGRQTAVTRIAEAQPPSAASAPTRTFLLMLGRGRLDEPSHGLAAIDAFLRTGLGPDDRVGLMAYTRVTDLTVDREPMLRLLDRYRERYKGIEMRLDTWFTGLTLAFGGPDIPPAIQRDIDAIFDAPGLPRLRDLPMMEAPGEFEFEFASHWVKRAADPLNDRESVDESTYAAETRQDFEALFNAIEYLRPVKGPKHLVYVTEYPLPFYWRDTDRLAEIANDAGVSIWPLQTGGNSPGGLNAPKITSRTFIRPSLGEMLKFLALQAFAEDTGGRASVQQFADQGLAAFESSTRFQYTLGYSPAHAGADGKYHDIKVLVNRKGVRVSHRGGYFARDHFVPTDEREFMANQRLRAAAAYWRNIVDIPLRWREQGATLQPGGEIAVQATIDPSGIVFENADGARTASLDVAVFAVDGDYKPIGESRQSIDLKVDEAKLAELKATGIPYSATVTPAGKAREVRLVVYQFSVDRLGTIVTKVR